MRIAVTAVGMLVLAALPGCDLISCSNEIASSLVSPDGDHTAIVFNRNCGATTGFNTQLSVVASHAALPDDGGNVLIADDTIELKVSWISASELSIRGLNGAKIFKQEKQVGGVAVSYE